MSRVRFHGYRQEPVALPPWETAYLITQCTDIAFSRLWPERLRLGELLRSNSGYEEESCRQMFCGAAITGTETIIGGRSFNVQTVALNTALTTEKHRLAARIAGQHEIHCYVEGSNRAWFTGQIEAGLASGSLRKAITTDKGEIHSCGWEDVLRFFAANERYPVVLSGSVTDDPGSVSPRSRFMATLRAKSQTDHLEMEPLSWSSFRFGDGQDSGDLLRAARGEVLVT